MITIKVKGCVKETTNGYIKPECPCVWPNKNGEWHCQFGCFLSFTILHTKAPSDCPLREGGVEIILSESGG
jgi:hypothetical protein